MVLIFGVVAHALDLMVPEAIRKKLEPMMFGMTSSITCKHLHSSCPTSKCWHDQQIHWL